VPGLLLAGYADLVASQLAMLWRLRRKDWLLPRGVDCINPKLRVLAHTVLPIPRAWLAYGGRPLKAEYLSENRVPCIDSNLLVLWAAQRWAEHTQRPYPFPETEVAAALGWYDPKWVDGLIEQQPFSDWQDSVARSGRVLLTHLLCLDFLHAWNGPQAARLAEMEEKVLRAFYRPALGLFVEQPAFDRVSLDSHAFLLTSPRLFHGLDRGQIYRALKAHPLWNIAGLPGVPVAPEYRRRAVAWTTRFVGLRSYHDGFHWGWLGAEAARIAWAMGDDAEAKRIAAGYAEAAKNESYLSEIYERDPSGFRPVKRRLYASECPFSWAAAKWIEALGTAGRI